MVYKHIVVTHKRKCEDMKAFFQDAKAKLEEESRGCQARIADMGNLEKKDKEGQRDEDCFMVVDDEDVDDYDIVKEDDELMSHVTLEEFA